MLWLQLEQGGPVQNQHVVDAASDKPATHAHTEAIERSYGQELRQVIAKARTQLKNDEQKKIGNHDPFASVPITDASRD